METPETGMTATKPPVWNAGGGEWALSAHSSRSKYGRSDLILMTAVAYVIAHCLAWRLIASCVATTLFG